MATNETPIVGEQAHELSHNTNDGEMWSKIIVIKGHPYWILRPRWCCTRGGRLTNDLDRFGYDLKIEKQAFTFRFQYYSLMTTQQQALWERIHAFQMDVPGVSFNFSTRLARENGWTKKFALRVIEEYKRFIFLCCISETGVTPSDAVDQAWHLHLTFTKSYWNDFCQETLEKEIHHNPTKGGNNEAAKFDNYYSSTKETYLRFFGQKPPTDIWPENDTRFSDIDFQRVNMKKFWLVKKPNISKASALFGFLFLSGSLLIQASDTSLIVTGICLAVFLVIIVRGIIRGDSGPGGCSAGCGSNTSDHDSGGSHHGGSGCSSGCSGCSSSGCSGCGGGGGGD